ncbi:MAG: PilX N-terminal domain-containing pilus assembly protein [Gammaproteobacteria bacterium]
MGRHSPSLTTHGQRGIALVITLVLLLVMTMIAVVAMRTTTTDLKMTINTSLQRRAFQSSEGGRTAIRRVLAANLYNGGWPPSAGGIAIREYEVPAEIVPVEPTAHFDTNENGLLTDVGPPIFTRDPDIQFRADPDDDDTVQNTDMFADIWVTYLGTRICAGCSAQVDANTTGAGAGNGNSHTFLDVRSRGTAPGNAELITGAEFRALVK